MREKESQIEPGTDIGKKVLELLKKRQGDETLYELSKATGMQQGTLRRKLENPNGWNEIDFINRLLKYLGVTYETLFMSSPIEETDSDLREVVTLFDRQSDMNSEHEKLMRSVLVIQKALEKLTRKVSDKKTYTLTTTIEKDPRFLELIKEMNDHNKTNEIEHSKK